MAEPVSWLLVEKGWKVEAADRTELGKVDGVVGDSSRDIFNGLVLSTGLLHHARYVPAELVTEIEEGRVRLSIGKDELDRLDEHHEPPETKRILPG